MGRDSTLQAFVGKKLDKFEKKKFSILAFLFGAAYMAYRKLIVPALLFVVIDCLLSIAIPNLIPFQIGIVCAVVMRIISGIIFPILYRNYYNKKVDVIINKININYEETARAKGGTNILFFVLVVMILVIVPANVRRLLGFDEALPTFTIGEEEEVQEEPEPEDEVQEIVQLELTTVDDEEFYNYNGETLTYNRSKNFKIANVFKVDTPYYFTRKADGAFEYKYEYKIKEDDKYLIKMQLNEVLGEYEAEKLAKGVNYFVNQTSVVSTNTINDITWYLCQRNDDVSKTYEYYTNINDKVYRLEISMLKDVDNDFGEEAQKLVNQLTGGIYKAEVENMDAIEWVLFETEEELERFMSTSYIGEPIGSEEPAGEEPVAEDPIQEEPQDPTTEEPANVPEITNSDRVPEFVNIAEISLDKKRTKARDDVDETYSFGLADNSEYDINVSIKDYMDIGAYEEAIKKETKVKYTKSDMSLNDIDWKVLVFEEMVNEKYNLIYAADLGNKIIVIDAKYVADELDEESSNIVNTKFSELFNAISKAE